MSAQMSPCPALDDRLWSLARPSPRGARPTLARMRRLLSLVGNPEQHLATVHIGGTSGKGSTCHLLTAVLDAAGYSTGMHTKPHLQTVRERLVLSGRPIDCAELDALLDRVAPLLDGADWPEGRPTWFELVVALAFTWFRERQARPTVVEVGLGGTWDATNVLQPLVAVLTSVGLDHTEILGDTIEAIASDKIGIFKANAVAISGVAQPSAQALVEERARHLDIPLWRLGREITVHLRRLDRSGASFDLTLPDVGYRDLAIGVLGRHQVDNAALAAAAAVALRRHGYRLTEDALRAGLAACRIPGRLEHYPGSPAILLDGAHNPQKMAALAAALQTLYPTTRPVCVVALRQGHDPVATLAPLLTVAGALVLTQVGASTDWGNEQSVDPQRLREAVGTHPGLAVLVRPVAGQALDEARMLAGANGLVCVTGSLYLVGELRQGVLPAGYEQ